MKETIKKLQEIANRTEKDFFEEMMGYFGDDETEDFANAMIEWYDLQNLFDKNWETRKRLICAITACEYKSDEWDDQSMFIETMKDYLEDWLKLGPTAKDFKVTVARESFEMSDMNPKDVEKYSGYKTTIIEGDDDALEALADEKFNESQEKVQGPGRNPFDHNDTRFNSKYFYTGDDEYFYVLIEKNY